MILFTCIKQSIVELNHSTASKYGLKSKKAENIKPIHQSAIRLNIRDLLLFNSIKKKIFNTEKIPKTIFVFK